MRLNLPPAGAAKAYQLGLFAILVSCASVGCGGDYCLIINSNPGGTVNTNLSCPTAKPTGNLAFTFGSSFTPSESAPLRTHVFVTLRGIDASAAMLGSEVPVWQELVPRLSDRPVQVDLTAPAARSCESGPLGWAAVPAGVYRELRLRLAPNPSLFRAEATAPPLEESACGVNLFDCLIPPNATAQPLTWDDPSEVVIAPERIQDGLIRVLPETSVQVSVALDPRSSLTLAADHALRLTPLFSASVQSECSPSE